MSAQDSGRDPEESGSKRFSDPVKAGVTCHRGALIMVDSSGYAKPGITATGLKPRGVCQEKADNVDGDDGDINVTTHSGVFAFENSDGGDEITAADLNAVCYCVNDQTVAKTSNSATRSPAGRVVRVRDDGKVEVQIDGPVLANGDLLAASNLSDVISAATARGNIGANKVWVHVGQVSTKAADTGVLRMPALAAGTLLKVKTVLNAALGAADATLQAKVAGSNAGSTTTGLITMTQSGSTAGDVDSASPVTTNVTFTEDQVLSFAIGGGSTATGTAEVYALISY